MLSVFQDKQGLLWFGTYSGLHRFNGYNLELFEVVEGDTTSLSNNAVNMIFEDTGGFLW